MTRLQLGVFLGLTVVMTPLTCSCRQGLSAAAWGVPVVLRARREDGFTGLDHLEVPKVSNYCKKWVVCSLLYSVGFDH